MKKSLIAAGAASLAVAALPIVGVFAADGNSVVKDDIEVTIDSACSLTSAIHSGATNGTQVTAGIEYKYTGTVTNSGNTEISGSDITVKCNDNGGWSLYAIGSGQATPKTSLKASNGTDIASAGTFTSGTSDWGMKVTGTNSLAKYNAGFVAVPAENDQVANSTSETDMTTGASVSTSYKVQASSAQEAGTYTGQVTYTLTHPKDAVVPSV